MLKKIETLIDRLITKKTIALYLVLYFCLITAVSLHRWWQFEYYYFDHGIFDQSLWSVAHGQLPYIDHFEKNIWLNQFGDHFTPTLYLLTPLYWLTDSYIPLLIIQNLFICAAAWVLWLLTREKKVPKVLASALLISFTWFLGLQNTIIAGFHTELPALLTLGLTLLFAEKKAWKWYWLCLILTFGLKETFVSIGLGIGIYLLLQKNYRQALATILFSVIYFICVTQLIIPAINGDTYGYGAREVSLSQVVPKFFLPVVKTKTLVYSLATFGFLSLVAWPALPLLMQDFFTRFVLTENGFTWDFGFHYSAMSSVLLFFSAVIGYTILVKKWSRYRQYVLLHSGLIIFMVMALHLKLHGALGLGFNPTFYQQSANHQFLANFVEQIPEGGLLMTQNNFAVRFTHSHKVMLLRDSYWRWAPDTIALDIRAGQNPNNFWPIESKALYDVLKQDPNYTLHEVTSEQVYFTKNENFDANYYVTSGLETQ